MAGDGATWPATALTIPIGGAGTFAEVTRERVVDAGYELGLGWLPRGGSLSVWSGGILQAAERLIAGMQSGMDEQVAASGDPDSARAFLLAGMHLIRAAHRIVINEMAQHLS